MDSLNNMEDKPKIPLPIETEGMNIHLSYIRRDVDQILVTLKDLKKDFVSRADFDEHTEVTKDHETRIRLLERNMWRWVGASSVISAGLAFLIQVFLE